MRRFASFRSLGWGLTLGVLLTIAAPVVGQTVQKWIQGGGYAGKISEAPYHFSHNTGRPQVVQVDRELFKIPVEYGEPFAVTTVGTQQVIWYRHPELGVRNVVVEKDRLLVQILPHEGRTSSQTHPEPGTR